MTEKSLSKALLEQNGGGSDQGKLQTWRILESDRRRVRAAAIVTVLLWLAASALVLSHLYMIYWNVLPKVEVLAIGAMHPGEPIDAEHRVMMQRHLVLVMRTLVVLVSIAVGIVTLAALATVTLVVSSRRATLRQINASLRELTDQVALIRSPEPRA
jgi:hypothetical protein